MREIVSPLQNPTPGLAHACPASVSLICRNKMTDYDLLYRFTSKPANVYVMMDMKE